MNLLRIIILSALIPVRLLYEDKDVTSQVYHNPDNFISDSVTVLPITYGQHTFYTTFINLSTLVSKCNSSSSCLIKRRNVFLPICLLLCGDIHPCPGPGPDDAPEHPTQPDF